jgi:lysozyme family protein
MAIDPEDFAEECVQQGTNIGAHPHYMLGVAKLRSGISDDSKDDKIGPFRLRQADWDANSNSIEFEFHYSPAQINDWLRQCVVFALMAHRAFEAFVKTHNRNPSALELYLQQWPDAQSDTLTADLQRALDETSALVGPAEGAVLGASPAIPAIISNTGHPTRAHAMRPGQYVFDAKRISFLFNGWKDMKIVRGQQEMRTNAEKLIKHKDIYSAASTATGVPWWMIAVIDMREGGIEHLGTRHLHNGDRLTEFTVSVPAGRPKVGHGPPFTWLESAIDALKLEALDTISNWTIERVLHKLEPYNGLAYYRNNRPSPYIWSCTTVYDPPTGPGGKVLVDHGPIENVVDPQNGCAPQLFIMSQIDTSIVFTHEQPPTS